MIFTLRDFLTAPFITKKGQPLFDNKQEQNQFTKRISEAASWCAEKLVVADPKNSLRSDFLKPALVVRDEWNYEITEPRQELDTLCETRAAAIKQPVKKPNSAGLVLLFWPNETLFDGAAAVASRGFFDDWNMPPWDTWFWYGNLVDEPPALVSWVPEEFVDLVREGISVNPEQCLRLMSN